MRHHIVVLVGLVASVALTGCLEREEQIVVQQDGSVEVSLSFRADSAEELYLGDPVPSDDAGWLVEAWIEEDDDGREVSRLTATQTFGPEVDLPQRLADQKDPYGDVALQFPTSVTVEERPDGSYYHFRRTYQGRPWARLEAVRQELLAEVGPLDAKRLEGLDDAERRAVVDALARSDLVCLVELARLAFLDVTPEATQDAWLTLLEAPRRALAELDRERLAHLLLQAEQEPEAVLALERAQADIEQRSIDAMAEALGDSGWYPPSQLRRFLHQLDQHRTGHEITRDLADERFTVRVHMPGTIVGHNGDTVAQNVVTWTFSGKAIRDRDVELMVTSRNP